MSPVLAANLQNRLSAVFQAIGADIKSINSRLGTTLLDTWHTVGSGGSEPAFNSGYSNFPANQAAQFRKHPDGTVRLRGYINTVAAGGAAFTLPVGYRPPATVRFMGNGQNAAGTQISALFYVLADGTVNIHGTNAPTVVDLSTIEFDTDTVTQFAVGPQGPQGPVGGNAQVPMDIWHIVGAAGEIPFGAGVSAKGGTEPAPGWRKYPDGKVRLKGVVHAPTGTATMFTLPAGARPPGSFQRFAAIDWNTGNIAYIYIQNDGTVAKTGATITDIDLSNIEFDTETVTQYSVGPQGPKGDAGGLTGLMQDLDDLNSQPYVPFRSRLLFHGPNFKYTDGGPADGFGGGDYTSITHGPQSGSGPLPSVGVREGTEYDLLVAPGVTWRMRYTSNRWVCVGGMPLTYHQEGTNAAYVAMPSGGNAIATAAAGTPLLAWALTPPVDVWVELDFHIGLVQKMDAAYHYCVMYIGYNVTPPITPSKPQLAKTQHSQVNTYEPYFLKGKFGLAAGVSYSLYCIPSVSGGSWTYYQDSQYVQLNGKAWPR